MTVNDVVNQLKYGELRSIAAKDDNFAIVSYINLALQALYNRFTLKISEQLIPLYNNVVEYALASDLMTGVFYESGNS